MSRLTEIGHVEALFRYPVKSMRGEPLDAANLGWHGLDGDRRLAFRRMNDHSGFPTGWLAGRVPRPGPGSLPSPVRMAADLPTHIRTPAGEDLAVFSQDLAAEVARRHGAPVQMMHVKHGIFDDANISVIASATVNEIARLADQPPDVRRFRLNIS